MQALRVAPANENTGAIQRAPLRNTSPSALAFNLTEIERKVFEDNASPQLCRMPYNTAYDAVKNTCGKICISIGARLPEPVLCPLLYEWLIKFFGEFTTHELQLAFDINAAGSEWETIQHFTSFDKHFIGAVLNRYRHYREQTYRKNKQALPLPSPYTQPTEEKKKEIENELLRVIVKDFKKFREYPDRIIQAAAYKQDVLDRLKLIQLSSDQKWDWFGKATRIHGARLKRQVADRELRFTATLKKVIELCERGEAPSSEGTEIKSLAKEMVLRYFFAKWHEEGFDLETALLK